MDHVEINSLYLLFIFRGVSSSFNNSKPVEVVSSINSHLEHFKNKDSEVIVKINDKNCQMKQYRFMNNKLSKRAESTYTYIIL